uniref:Disintegrin and metalloproteinase domain-containing protein 20-like n=1 Tax=Salvator merianae TaxID=96440 RepID=A0A8D0BSU3_SALMN
MDYLFISDDCFYHGFIQGEPSSLITLSSCLGGLRGLLQIGNKTYGIEPFLPSATFQHVVYRVEQKKGGIHLSCGLTAEEQSHQEAMIGKAKYAKPKHSEGNWWTHARYIEVAIVVEHQLYNRFGRNQTFIAVRVLEIIHIANTFYKPLGVHISLAGIEIWSEKNLIEIADYMVPLLINFNTWRKNELNQHLPSDAGHLFVYKRFGRTVGLAYTGKICNPHWASAVESYLGYSIPFFAVLFAHELGHNLGMGHDTENCHCERKSCIMAPFPGEVDQFSNCSYKDYFRLRNSACLLTPPDPEKLFKFKFCGNKIVEDGEQCDCGSALQCKSDPCCQTDCKLRSGATCNIGLCCAHCQHLPAGTVCRKKVSSCDLPEYCNGTSPLCPEDVFVQDGAPCKGGAHCYRGRCTTHTRQCKTIFGKRARVAANSCFRLMNVRGDRFGNCGWKDGIYKKCNPNNILCGRIQCSNVYKLPSLMEDSTIIQTSVGSTECWGTDYHGGKEIPDVGAVRDGTPCGAEMMCISGECVNFGLPSFQTRAPGHFSVLYITCWKHLETISMVETL